MQFFRNTMKKLEIIVPNGRERDVHEELISLNVGGMLQNRGKWKGKVGSLLRPLTQLGRNQNISQEPKWR
jgi:hypothetical protein